MQFSFGNPAPYSPGIDAMVNLKGFTVQPYVAASKKAIFTLDSAPDPTRCRVVYDTLASEVALTWVPAAVTYDTSGC